MKDRFNLTALALGQRELSWFFIFLIGVAGIFAYTQLGQREDPDFTFRGMVIRTIWPGATSGEMDRQVTRRIVRKLQEVPYYRDSFSYSRDGESVTILRLLDTAPPEEVPELWYQVRKKIGDIRHDLPAGVEEPTFNDEFGDVYGSIYAFTGDGYSMEELRRYAEMAQQEIVRLPDVAKADLIGAEPQVITITISTSRLATLGVPPLAIARAIQSQNIVQDSGRLHAADFSVPLHVLGNFESVDEVRNVPIRVNGKTFRLSDIATISRGYLDPPVETLRYGGKPAVGLAISMKKNGDVLRLGKDLEREMNALKARLPVGISFARVSDQPQVVKGAVGEFMRSFLEAVAIVLLVSFASLGMRAGMVVAITIPLVIAATFLLMRIFHIDLHRISTGALIIALGLLVDDAMIVVEMMARKLEEGYDRFSAATFSYRATVFPMLAGTLITASGFLPIGTAKSATGEYTFAMFAVVTLALLVSWFAAIFVTPLAGYHLLKSHEGLQREVFETPFYHRLRKVIDWCLANRKTVLAGTFIAFLLGILGMGLTEKQFFPSSNRIELLLDIWLPENSSIRATEREAGKIEAILAKDRDVSSFVTYVGHGSPRFFLSLDQQLYRPNFAQIVMLTRDLDARRRVQERMRKIFANGFPEDRLRIYPVLLGPPITYPVEFRVLGDDLATAKTWGDRVAELMRKDPRLRDVHPDWGMETPAMQVRVDQVRASAAGVSSQDIARTLRTATDGIEVSQMQEGDQLVSIMLRSPPSERKSLEEIGSIEVPTSGGASVPLRQVASVSYILEDPILWRKDRDISMSVRSDVIEGVQPTDVASSVDEKLNELRKKLPEGFRIEAGGELGENSGAQDSIRAGMPLMIAVIFSILMIQMKSFSRSFMVVLTAPLGIVGVALALLLFHKPFGFVAMLGTIALGGMIMRNTVILIDQIRQDREAGLSPEDAIRESTVRRFRPIMLTSAAAMLAMIPLTRSVLWGPMAYAIMGGLLVATLLTVLFIPALYATWLRLPKR
ncbi:MAG: efflux RND transporter permease subunit [Burkholderiales bacterium]|nr:efflux RND transporter permease subunit [Burkholderiales bacterium]